MSKTFYQSEGQKESAGREKLNQYLRGTSVTAILLLLGTVAVISGLLVWVFSKEYFIGVRGLLVSESGKAALYVDEAELSTVTQDMTGRAIIIEATPCRIVSTTDRPQQAGEILDAYEMHVGKFEKDTWIYTVVLDADLPDTVSRIHVRTGAYGPTAIEEE